MSCCDCAAVLPAVAHLSAERHCSPRGGGGFDRVWGWAELIASAADGYNVCVMAYGQTGTGKTHTMEGTAAQPGICSRALTSLFELQARCGAMRRCGAAGCLCRGVRSFPA